MKRRRSIAAAFVLAVALCFLAGSLPARAERAHSLEPGSWSLQFQIADNIGLRTFNGMNISAKRHLSERAAIRAGVGLGLSFEDQTSDQTELNEFTTENSIERNQQNISFDVLYMRYVKPGANVNLLWGVGPLVKFGRLDSEETSYQRAEDPELEVTNIEERFERYWSLGVLGIIGAEWFLTKNFSFHTEYRSTFSYRHSYSERTRTRSEATETRVRRDEGDGATWLFSGSGVLLGLSVYF